MADLLTVDALVEPFGLTAPDLLEWADHLPPDVTERATFWMAVYLRWIERVGLRAKLGDPLLEQTSDRAQPNAGDASAALESWFRTLDDAARTARAGLRGIDVPFEAYAAHAFLVEDPVSPYHRATDLPDSLDSTLGAVLARAKDIALPEIDSTVGKLGQPMPLVWNADPGPTERRLRRRHGNLLFPREQRLVEQWDIDCALPDDEDALRRHEGKLRAVRQQQLDVADATSVEHRHRMIDDYDDLIPGLLCHGNAKSMQWYAEITTAREELVEALRNALTGNPKALQHFNTRREAFRERDAWFSHAAYAEMWGRLEPDDMVSTVCSLEPEEIAFVLPSVIKIHYPHHGDFRSACARRFAEAIQEGFPAEIAAARLRAMERLPGFPPDLKQRANLWIALYVLWSYRLALQGTFGAAFEETASHIALRLRGRGVGNPDDASAALEWWFQVLENAFNAWYEASKRDTSTSQAAWYARAFLERDTASPHHNGTDVPELAESILAEALCEAMDAAGSFIDSALGIPPCPGETPVGTPTDRHTVHRFHVVETLDEPRNDRELIDSLLQGLLRPAPLVWSASPGPAERHVRRRQGNLLFPPEKRIVTQAHVDRAREQDEAALRNLVETFLATEQKQIAWPANVPATHINEMLKEWDGLNERFLIHGGPEAMRWQAKMATVRAPLLKALKIAGTANFTVRRAFKAWREAERERDERNRNPEIVALLGAPQEDFASTVCSLEPEAIAYFFRLFDANKEVAEIVRTECARMLAQAVQEGFPAETAAARLKAIERHAS